MNDEAIPDLAYFLTCSWALAAGNVKLPISHGVLDSALWSLKQAGSLPPLISDSLHFAMTPRGPRCSEVPSIIRWAQGSGLVTNPNPTFKRVAVTLDHSAVRLFLRSLEVEEDQAEEFGVILKAAVATAEDEKRPA